MKEVLNLLCIVMPALQVTNLTPPQIVVYLTNSNIITSLTKVSLQQMSRKIVLSHSERSDLVQRQSTHNASENELDWLKCILCQKEHKLLLFIYSNMKHLFKTLARFIDL